MNLNFCGIVIIHENKRNNTTAISHLAQPRKSLKHYLNLRNCVSLIVSNKY